MTVDNASLELYQFLKSNQLTFEMHEHPPLFSCLDAEKYGLPPLPGADTKNLFLVNENREFYLVTTLCAKSIALNELKRQLKLKKLSFGSEADLLDMLGVTPGAVTVLGTLFDINRKINLIIDSDVWNASHLQAHPCRNDQTLVLAAQTFKRFLEILEITPTVMDLPTRS